MQRTSDNVGRAESIESRWHLGLITDSLTKVLYLKDKKQTNKKAVLEKNFKSNIFKQVIGKVVPP